MNRNNNDIWILISHYYGSIYDYRTYYCFDETFTYNYMHETISLGHNVKQKRLACIISCCPRHDYCQLFTNRFHLSKCNQNIKFQNTTLSLVTSDYYFFNINYQKIINDKYVFFRHFWSRRITMDQNIGHCSSYVSVWKRTRVGTNLI